MRKVRARLRRATRVRSKIRGLTVFRLTVHRTPRHIYAQVVDKIGKVFAFASTVDLEVKEKINYAGNVKAAEVVGECVAKRAFRIPCNLFQGAILQDKIHLDLLYLLLVLFS